MAKVKKRYPLEDSCLYKLESKGKLARILLTSVDTLEKMAEDRGQYEVYFRKKKNGKKRLIEAPKAGLKRTQKRIALLLQSIQTPEFVMSPVWSRSYVDNAREHVGSEQFRLLDVESFFPSCCASKVLWFFRTRLCMSPDVSRLLAGICTFDGHLPTGSPASPILSYFAYSDMWAEVHDAASAGNCKFSLYIDDLTISGTQVSGELAFRIKQILFKHGHRYSRSKEQALANGSAVVTGCLVTRAGLQAPLSKLRELKKLENQLGSAPDDGTAAGLRRTIEAKRHQLAHIRSRNKPTKLAPY